MISLLFLLLLGVIGDVALGFDFFFVFVFCEVFKTFDDDFFGEVDSVGIHDFFDHFFVSSFAKRSVKKENIYNVVLVLFKGSSVPFSNQMFYCSI